MLCCVVFAPQVEQVLLGGPRPARPLASLVHKVQTIPTPTCLVRVMMVCLSSPARTPDATGRATVADSGRGVLCVRASESSEDFHGPTFLSYFFKETREAGPDSSDRDPTADLGGGGGAARGPRADT